MMTSSNFKRSALHRFFARWCALALLVPHLFCGGAAGLISSATSDGTGATSTGTAEALSGTESQLFEDGPVELPVTIAKLDSPDLSLITVTVEEISTSTGNVVKFATGSTHVFTITGSAGAGGKLSDGSFAPKLFVFNSTTGEQAISSVNADGSFVGQIDGQLTDTIAFASMTEAEDQVSPILTVEADGDGNFIVTTTNAADLSFAVNVMTDADGNYYFTVKADDGTYTLLRRSLSGTEVETIDEGLANQPRVILAGSGPAVTVIFQDGSVVAYAQPAPAGVTAGARTARGLSSEADGTWTAQNVDQISGGLIGEELAWPGHSLMYSATERTVAFTLPYTNFFSQTTNDSLLRFVDLTGTGEVVTVISPSEYDAAYADVGESGKIYAFVSPVQTEPNGSDYILYRFDFLDVENGGIETAWSARETLIASFVDVVASLDASDGGEIVFSFTAPDNKRGLAYWSETLGDPTPINDIGNDTNAYAYPKISPDGKFVVFCRLLSADIQTESVGQLTVYFPGDAMGTFTPLFDSGDFTTCSDNPASFFIDSRDRIHFYETPSDGSDPQLGVIDPRQHAAFESVELPALE